jgi:hypothetical protein
MNSSNHLVQNNFGASFGGPIVRDKTFFFVNYEGLRHTRAMTMIQTVPTEMEAMGDFSPNPRVRNGGSRIQPIFIGFRSTFREFGSSPFR